VAARARFLAHQVTPFAILTRRVVVKIFVAMAVVVTALWLYAWRESAREIRELRAETERSAGQLANLTTATVEHAMLEGKAVTVRELLGRIETRVPDAEIRVFDFAGVPVFQPKTAPPASLPAPLAGVLGDGQRRVDDGLVWRPVPHEERCRPCHPDQGRLRGVLALRVDAGRLGERHGEVLGQLVGAAFVSVMSYDRKGARDRVEAYLAEAGARAAIYDHEGDLAFGDDLAPADAIATVLAPGAASRELDAGGRRLRLEPLPMQPRCQSCHAKSGPVRGVLAVEIPPSPDLEPILDGALRHIMLASLGRMIARFLDVVAETGAVSDLSLYDEAGRLFYTTRRTEPAPQVTAALSSRKEHTLFVGAGAEERVLIARPLLNEPECVRCHDTDEAVRGAVTVSLSTHKAALLRDKARRRTFALMVATLVSILVLLYVILGWLVIRPVQEMGWAAEQIGGGNLEVHVSRRARLDGDEVQRLGSRFNEMVHGLRTKLLLERFVSRGAAQAASGAAARTATHRAVSGERKPAAVVFTDIRGFTAFSETVAPEEVVALLNEYLDAQTAVVEKHGGDVDKYVGDEVMAVFTGPDATARAVRCAVEMIESVAACPHPTAEFGVGAGVSSGDVVYGPVGSASRQDFTVIGDVVNTGARLCSAARANQVIVSDPVRAACALEGIEFTPLEPISVKGKREPLSVFEARRKR
jgi:class 3 adenylate cyclase